MTANKRIATITTCLDSGDSLLERLPESILNEIFIKLEYEEEGLTTICSVACVSKTLQFSVNRTRFSFPSLDLSTFSLDSETLKGFRRRFGKIKKITLDCFCMKDSSITSFLGAHVEELTLLRCSSFSFRFLNSVGKTCPNLRVLTVEFSGFIDKTPIYEVNAFANCPSLELITLKVREGKNDSGFTMVGKYHLLPQAIKLLKFQPEFAFHTVSVGQTLTHISLVLNVITDQRLMTIANGLPLLVELDLEDRPRYEDINDLSNIGFYSLTICKHLTSLSLIRGQQHVVTSFKRTSDLGMFFLSHGFKRLEHVRLGGFTEVSDTGFTIIFKNCLNLKKLEIRNSSLLTDLSFQDVSKIRKSVIEVKLVSCSSITSEGVCELATCGSLVVLDLLGCQNVEDSCISNVSRLTLLTSLNLGGTNVTDVGMSVLGKGNAPISCLSLRGCTKITDKGIAFLLRTDGKFSETLTSLDLGHMPGITDNAISTIADACVRLTELCIRNCFNVTDASMKALALKGRVQGETGKLLRRLDVNNCTGISAKSFEYLKKPSFRGLQWIGIGRSHMFCGDGVLAQIYSERRWLFICVDGCEIGCQDGWQFHKY